MIRAVEGNDRRRLRQAIALQQQQSRRVVGSRHGRRQRRPAGIHPGDARAEHLAQPPARLRRVGCRHGREHFFIEARHRRQVRRPHLVQVLHQGVGRLRQGHRRPRRHADVMVHGAGVDVRQRQPVQHQIARPIRHHLQRGQAVAQQVAVRQHHALGVAGRARRVNDRGEVVRPQPLLPPPQFLRLSGQRPPAALNEASP